MEGLSISFQHIFYGAAGVVLVLSVRGVFMLPHAVDTPSYLSDIGSIAPTESSLHPSEVSIYVINLDRDQHRYRAIVPLLMQLHAPYQRVPGVEGKTLSSFFIKNNVDVERYAAAFNGASPGRGEIGCFLSHVKVWAAFLNSKAKFAVILEDDAKFDPKVLQVLVEQLIRRCRHWDICSFFSPIKNHGTQLVCQLTSQHKLVRLFQETSGTVGLMLNRKAAKALLSKAEKYVLPVDHYIQRTWEFSGNIRFVAVLPSPVSEEDHSSSIEQSGRRDKGGVGSTWIKRFFQRTYTQISHMKSALAYYLYNQYLGYFFSYEKDASHQKTNSHTRE